MISRTVRDMIAVSIVVCCAVYFGSFLRMMTINQQREPSALEKCEDRCEHSSLNSTVESNSKVELLCFCKDYK